MADDTIPNARFSLPGFNISQAPFLQSYNGVQSPFANMQDQIQQSQQISGVYPGQMPDNTFLGNTAARYAFGRTLPGSSPYQGALTSYMQGKGMPTGIPLGLLGLQGGIGQPPPPNSSGPPYPGGSSPGNYPPPSGSGPPNQPPPGGPAPPPFPGGAGGPPGPGGPPPGPSAPPPSTGTWSNGYQSPGLLGGQMNDSQAPAPGGGHVRQGPVQVQPGMQARAAGMPTDPSGKVMYSIVNRLPWNATGLSAEQYNQLYYALPSDWNRAAYKAPR